MRSFQQPKPPAPVPAPMNAGVTTKAAVNISLNEQNLIKDIAAMDADLNNPANAPVRTMTEAQFVHVFLPMFAGDPNGSPYAGVDMDMYRNFAGGPYREVSVLDENGNQIFRIPPLFNPAAMKPLDGTGEARTIATVSDMITRAQLIAKQGAVAMDNYIKNELARRDFMFTSAKDETAYIDRWNFIFARYKRPLLPGGSTDTPTAATALNKPVDPASQEFDSF